MIKQRGLSHIDREILCRPKLRILLLLAGFLPGAERGRSFKLLEQGGGSCTSRIS